MIGLDTNVLVRYLTQDEPAQARRAPSLIEKESTAGGALRVSSVVLCELVRVLRGAYRLSKTEIADTLERMLGTAQLDIEDRDLVRAALADYRSGPADFADYLVGRRNRAHGCSETVTFDARLKRSDLFRVLPASS